MKIAGILFIVCSAGSVGFRIASSLRRRCILLRSLLAALQVLKQEVSFCGTPLPQAFALMAISSRGVTERVFSAVAKEMDRRCWVTPQAAVRQAISKEQEIDEPIRAALLQMAAGLGKYDRDSQVQTLEVTQTRLEELLRQAEQERSVRGRTYEILGICAGLALAILLI